VTAEIQFFHTFGEGEGGGDIMDYLTPSVGNGWISADTLPKRERREDEKPFSKAKFLQKFVEWRIRKKA
jgi:hypothetical protein